MVRRRSTVGRSASARLNRNYRQRQTNEERDRRLENMLHGARLRRFNILENSRARSRSLLNEAFNYDCKFNYKEHTKVTIGQMNNVCKFCQALRFSGESNGLCCNNGKVILPEILSPPNPLKSLVFGTNRNSTVFLKNVRKYNACFQMTSFGVKNICNYNYPSTFRIQGQIYHQLGSILPTNEDNPNFLQIYFIGNHELEANRRCSIISNVDLDIVTQIQMFLHEHNKLIHLFKFAIEKMPTDRYRAIINPDKTPIGEHERRYNAPTTDEIAIVMVGHSCSSRDIVLHCRDTTLTRISETHRSYDGLQYPLMFWNGDDGYHFQYFQRNVSSGLPTNKKISSASFYCYRLMIRANNDNYLLKFRQLLNQFVVDMYAKIESERLLYIKLHQQRLRSEEYVHLQDAIQADVPLNDIGKKVYLPSSFIGSPRHMHEYTQDAMTYVRIYGRPDLFITFTCNPKWSEIQALLSNNETPTDRHDVISRVFKQKLIKLMDVIVAQKIFSDVNCWMYSIEWQKRGLPHAHILLWLTTKIQPTDIDSIVCAELPNRDIDPELFEVVMKNMIHGPCGPLNSKSPCMINNKCSKRYPKPFVDATKTGSDGYPIYRRRSPNNGGTFTEIRISKNNRWQNIVVDNKWIVPYNPLLSKMFQAHINVEYCNSVKSIKYICKYVNKGSDMAVLEVAMEHPHDEVLQYQTGRYISSNEAFWRIYGFAIHERFPAVVHLSVHLENGQRVYFTENNINRLLEQPPDTTLTAFFKLCRTDSFATTLLYNEIPTYYTWNKSRKEFNRRKRGVPVPGYSNVLSAKTLSRMYMVHPSQSECFFLRILLHHVRGPKSFADLKTVNGVVCNSFKNACIQFGLLELDTHWHDTMRDAVVSQMPKQLRQLLAIILICCSPSDPQSLWDSFKNELSEDILRQARLHDPHAIFDSFIYHQSLILLEDTCLAIASKSLNQLGLESPVRDAFDASECEFFKETNYNQDDLRCYVSRNKPKLTVDQLAVFEAVVDATSQPVGRIFFLDAPGGTGKTFVLNLILAEIRKNNEIAVAIASSGIAATLLEGGLTVHSVFKLPLDIKSCDKVTCNISKSSATAKILKKCKIIVWDECTMSHRSSLEAVEDTLRDFRNNNLLLGGTVLLLAGDFRQTLPVIPKSTPADEIDACLKSSKLWNYVHTLTLTTNMRVQLLNEPNAYTFADQLLRIGNGCQPFDKNPITFPENFCTCVTSAEELIDKVFPQIVTSYKNEDWIRERALLTPLNDDVTKINDIIINLIPGPMESLLSIDTITDPEQAVHFPTEFLNSLEVSGMPPHNLKLKLGVTVMLLRNLNPPKLCNGTRLLIKNIGNNILEATILTGNSRGEDVFIPRIPLISINVPFQFKRLQFPVRICYAMSINKSQGQSLRVAGLCLSSPCFSHGQLYVACSRVGSPSDLFAFVSNRKTNNIVYKF